MGTETLMESQLECRDVHRQYFFSSFVMHQRINFIKSVNGYLIGYDFIENASLPQIRHTHNLDLVRSYSIGGI